MPGTEELIGKVALVTGGASGIGAETCRILAAAGARVIVADLQDGLGQKLVAELGPRARFHRLDVADEASWASAMKSIDADEGRLDALVNNAGIGGGPGTIETTTRENWDKVFAVNVDGVFLGCRFAIGAMKSTSVAKAAPRGSIVNISSIAGIIGSAGPVAYTAAKGAVRLLTKSVAMYCADKRYNIRCNSIHPGGIETPILKPFMDHFGREEVLKRMGAMHPVGHLGQPRDIAEAAMYLISDRSGFVTGAELVVDGGITANAVGRFSLAS